jgi:hypothetical protein
LPDTPLRKRGNKGETRFYRGPTIDRSPSWNLTTPDGKRVRACDLLGPGRQTLLPPTIHPDTKQPYVWLDGVALEDIDPESIPELDPEALDRIGEALRPFGWQAQHKPQRLNGNGAVEGGTSIFEDPWRALNEDSLAALYKWVPDLNLFNCRPARGGYEAVATWRPSNSGKDNEHRDRNLRIHPKGIRDFGDDRGYTPIDLVVAAKGLDPDDKDDRDTAFGFLAERVWGLLDAPPVAPDMPPHDPQTGEVIEDAPGVAPDAPRVSEVQSGLGAAQINPEAAGEPLEALTYNIPGLVGAVVDHVCDTARNPCRVLALGTALTLLGTAMGRRVMGPPGYETGTHLYVVGLAPTASGKDWPLKSVTKIAEAAGLECLIGAEGFMSMTSVYNFLDKHPLSVCPFDEFGDYLRRINGKKSGHHETAVLGVLKTAWGRSFDTMKSPEWADRKSFTIYDPALSIFGVSTPHQFFEALNGGDLSGGFLNRFLLLQSPGRPPKRTPKYRGVPEELAKAIAGIHYYSEGDKLMSMARPFESRSEIPPPFQMKWGAPAERYYEEAVEAVVAKIDRDQELEHFIGRTAEMGLRLAIIRATGNYQGTIALEDIEWGVKLATASGNLMVTEARAKMVYDLSGGQLRNKIEEKVKEAGRITKRDLYQKLKRYVSRAKDLDEPLKLLIEAGLIAPPTKVDRQGGGTPTVWLQWTGPA